MTPEDRNIRNDCMRWERARGATIRALAQRFRLSKSQAHRVVASVELLPAAPRFRYVLVPAPAGGFIAQIRHEMPPVKAYRVHNGRRA